MQNDSQIDYKQLVVRMLSGSKAYELDVSDSDTDYVEVCFLPVEYYVGLRASRQLHSTQTIENGVDTVRHEFTQYLRLLLSGNPSLLPLLWQKSGNILLLSHAFMELQLIRESFVSKASAKAFFNMAVADANRSFDEPVIVSFTKYKKRKTHAHTSQTSTIEYDPKLASRTLRTLAQLIYLLSTKSFCCIPIMDYTYLNLDITHEIMRDIRTGSCPKDLVFEYVCNLLYTSQSLLSACDLPEESDYKKVEEFCMRHLMDYLNKNYRFKSNIFLV